ncbi:MAG: hypothetical protein HUJ28_11690 [Chromatiales bacterium]|nr:hypothetical protein [Chromatiales bacterium]
MSLHFNHVNLILRVTIEDDVLAQHSAASPEIVGTEIAQQVMDYVRDHDMGYYPALDYFRQQGGIDEELLEAAESLAWLACNLAREEVKRKTREVFSNVQFEAVQSLAFTMPTVRPGQNNAYTRLSDHYTPNSVKLDMDVSLIQKQPADASIERYCRHVISRWLKHSFRELEVSAYLSE